MICRAYYWFAFLLFAALFLGAEPAASAKQESDPLAIAFGKIPYIYGARLSPDGSKISFIHMVEAGVPVAFVMPVDGDPTPVVASTPGKFDIYWCDWANNERLLCGFYGIDSRLGVLLSVTRLVAVNIDGSDQRVLLQNKLKNQRTQFQDDIVDFLPDDPQHVLVGVPSDRGAGVSRLNIYNGQTKIEERIREGSYEYISDGRGIVRLRQYRSTQKKKWYFRLAESDKWEVLHESPMDDLDDDYYPMGFGPDRNALFVYKKNEGRLALMSEDLERKREDQIIFSHDEVDIGGTLTLGKFDRLVAAAYR